MFNPCLSILLIYKHSISEVVICKIFGGFIGLKSRYMFSGVISAASRSTLLHDFNRNYS